MEQLQLLVRESPSRVPVPQEIRDELINRLREAIVLVFLAERGGNHDLVTSKDSS